MLTLPALTGDKEQSLSAALSGMLAEYEAALELAQVGEDGFGGHAVEVKGDPHVTTVRRLPAEFARRTMPAAPAARSAAPVG